MFETIGVLIVFFILLGLGISVYFVVQKSSYAKDTEQRKQLEGLTISQKMMYLPELDCNLLQTTQEVCFDEFKLNQLRLLLQTDTDAKIEYFKLFGESKITINTIYPEQKPQIIIYDKKPQETTTEKATQSPILLKNPITNSKSFGYIEVKRYFK